MKDFLKTNSKAIVSYGTTIVFTFLMTYFILGAEKDMEIQIKDSKVTIGVGMTKILEKLDEIDVSLKYCTEFIYKDIVRRIEKQYIKIGKHPEDVNAVDLTTLFEEWKGLPESWKTEEASMRIEALKVFYSENF